ncbi:MAG: ATP-binding protein [Cytophagales bacterium]|nr:ATP-binding protein [Bernardetiaceae bacterium]MDW8203770.1 ATP-binding protein [Cytophagales bacterium]
MINLQENPTRFNIVVLIMAAIIGIGSIIYTNSLVGRILEQEKQQTSIFAKVQEYIASVEANENVNTLIEVIDANYTYPVILTDENDKVLGHRNIRFSKGKDSLKHLASELEEMKAAHPPIVVEPAPGLKNFIYYKNSDLVTQLQIYPYVELFIIAVFFLIVYILFNASRKAEQNKVWVGLAKETAHQLGTPISSLMAWMEYFKTDSSIDESIIAELEKDVTRLEMITARFSSIGSPPVLKFENVEQLVKENIDYLQKRISSKVQINIRNLSNVPLDAPLNRGLFEWVIENVCKNAVDAMGGVGKINIFLSYARDGKHLQIDIADTGKGIPKSLWKHIFKPGYTTKKRGWGLGLTLAKRIVEDYHKGSITVLSSAPNEGTTFRILLPRF